MNSPSSSTDPSGRVDRLVLELGIGPSAPASAVEAAFVGALFDLAPGARLLDAPCGNGRHAGVFAAAGYRVTAVDADALAVSRAKEALRGLPARTMVADLFALDVALGDEPHDAAVSLYSCLGYCCDRSADVRFLRTLRTSLRPGAPLVLGTANAAVVFASGETETHFDHDGFTIRRQDLPHPDRGLLERRFSVETAPGPRPSALRPTPRRFVEWRRLYDPRSVAGLLEDAGFAVTAMFGGFSPVEADVTRDPHLLYQARAR